MHYALTVCAKSEWKLLKFVTDLVASVKSLVTLQLKDLRRSLHGQGKFVVSGPFTWHQVSYNTWQASPANRRNALFARFLADYGKCQTLTTTESEDNIHC